MNVKCDLEKFLVRKEVVYIIKITHFIDTSVLFAACHNPSASRSHMLILFNLPWLNYKGCSNEKV